MRPAWALRATGSNGASLQRLKVEDWDPAVVLPNVAVLPVLLLLLLLLVLLTHSGTSTASAECAARDVPYPCLRCGHCLPLLANLTCWLCCRATAPLPLQDFGDDLLEACLQGW